MRQLSQITKNIVTLAQYELKGLGIPWDHNFSLLIHHAVYGTECYFSNTSTHKTPIPWELIRILTTHVELRTHIHSSGIRITNSHITSMYKNRNNEINYDFFLCESLAPLVFKECHLTDGTLSLQFSKIKSLSLYGSTVHAVRLDAAQVEGGLIFDHCFFNVTGELSIKADELKTGGRLSLKSCYAVGGVRLRRAHVGGDLEATGAFLVSTNYGKYLWSTPTVEEQNVRAVRDKILSISSTDERRQVESTSSIIKTLLRGVDEYEVGNSRFKALDLYDASIAGNVKIWRGFISLGEVSLNSAQIASSVLARGGFIFQLDGVALSMDGATIRMSLYIQRDDDKDELYKRPFVVHGSVSMRGAIVLQRFVCSNTYFLAPENLAQLSKSECGRLLSNPMREREFYALFAKRLHVGGDLILNKIIAREGDASGVIDSYVSLENANIGGRLFFRGTPNFEVYKSGEQIPPFLNLDFARIAGSVNLEIGVNPSSSNEIGVNPSSSNKCMINFRSTTAGSIDLSECNHDRVVWDLEGLKYNTVERYRYCKGNDGAKVGIDIWIEKILRAPIQPYDEFISFLREAGDEGGGAKGRNS